MNRITDKMRLDFLSLNVRRKDAEVLIVATGSKVVRIFVESGWGLRHGIDAAIRASRRNK